MQSIKRNILLNPGPATTSDQVKLAQVVPDICPREKEFGQVMAYVTEELTKVVAAADKYTTVLFGGSGTAAVEAILCSVIHDDKVLIINNGSYGQRMLEIAEVYGLTILEFNSPPDQELNLKALEEIIKINRSQISHLAVVHNETTTGLLNDISAIGQMCKVYDVDLIVDAMSSFAAIPIEMQAMNISYLAASSNKNMQGMPGVSFVIADKSKLLRLQNKPRRSYYLSLYDQYLYFQTSNQMRFTPPVQTIYALKQAIEEFKEEGITARYKRYTQSWNILINGLQRLGLKHLVAEKNHSKIVTAVIEPCSSKYDFNEMHDFFYQRGYTIYPGKLKGLNTFRIANIGDITSNDLEGFIEILNQYLSGIGWMVNGGEFIHEGCRSKK